MIGLCDMCAFRQSDCKGNKDLEKVHCPYYKKPDVFNAKEAAERIAELEDEVNKIVRCGECKFKRLYDEDGEAFDYCALEVRPNRNWTVEDTDFCSWGERSE